MRSQACIIIVDLFIAIVVLTNGRADLDNAMLVAYNSVVPQFHDFLQSNAINQVSIMAT